MSKFPKEEAKIMELAREMADGLAANTEIYPAPPVATADIQAAITTCITARDAVLATQSALEKNIATKNEAFGALSDLLKSDLRYAENTVKYDDASLKLIGWGGRHAATPLAIPGQTRSLHAPAQGEGWIQLAWKKPLDGGKVAAYRLQRRAPTESSAWLDAGMAVEPEITLTNQERGKALEYCVVAVNKMGDGEVSNTVSVVL